LAAVIDNPTNVLEDVASVKAIPRGGTPAKAGAAKTPKTDHTASETAVELGIWLSGLESFLSVGHYAFRSRDAAQPATDYIIESRLAQSTMMRCVRLNARLLLDDAQGKSNVADLEREELDELAATLRELVQIGQCIVRADPLTVGEWKAWAKLLHDKFNGLAAFHKLIRNAEDAGAKFLPEPLKSFAASEGPLSDEDAELALVLPRFAKILRWLNVVGQMLEADEPLKPSLLIFSRVQEQATDLVSYINNRLTRFANEDAELFASLDAASYTASIELKKVYNNELANLVELRPPPHVCSGIEAAHAMLNESFQQTLAHLARLVDPSVDVTRLFASYRINFERSLTLRGELWKLVRLAQAAEANPEKKEMDALNRSLREFTSGTIRFLFYKDTETFERFVEEILVTKQTKDLVPILHRFGAYLETLFGQVSMRAVLENHPFDPKG